MSGPHSLSAGGLESYLSLSLDTMTLWRVYALG